MLHLHDVVDPAALTQHIDQGYVRAGRHPETPLTIYNYTAAAQYDNHWTPVTTQCRGLIVADNGLVVARPFAKFFNYGQIPTPQGPVHVTDKADGSLGIIYPHPDGRLHVATRSSFTSEQALHATELLHGRYRHFEGVDGWTFLVEIIYPGNRVVVDYDDYDDLVLLGAVDIRTGKNIPLHQAQQHWPGPVIETYPYQSLEDALTAPDRPNREGFVLHFLDSDERIKIKQADYVRLHKLIFGLNGKTIYETLRDPDASFDELLEQIPDELYDWVHETRQQLEDQHAKLTAEAVALFETTVATLQAAGITADQDGYAKAFAEALNAAAPHNPLRHAAFSLRSGKPFDMWKLIDVPTTTPTFTRTTDD